MPISPPFPDPFPVPSLPLLSSRGPRAASSGSTTGDQNGLVLHANGFVGEVRESNEPLLLLRELRNGFQFAAVVVAGDSSAVGLVSF